VRKIYYLTLDFTICGHTIHSNPDSIFNQHIALIPLLPASHVKIWGIYVLSILGSPQGRHDLLYLVLSLLPCHLS
jgi:hypothetical protein